MLINLTQHLATPEQMACQPFDRDFVRELLTFEEIPTIEEMKVRAEKLADFAVELGGITAAMIGGAPFFMPVLEAALVRKGITPVYAFSRRETVDEEQPDGSVRKVSVFRHLGFVEAATTQHAKWFDQDHDDGTLVSVVGIRDWAVETHAPLE
jgi:hypothetical protein